MAVFNSFTDSCENIATSSILEYYNTVGEYVSVNTDLSYASISEIKTNL